MRRVPKLGVARLPGEEVDIVTNSTRLAAFPIWRLSGKRGFWRRQARSAVRQAAPHWRGLMKSRRRSNGGGGFELLCPDDRNREEVDNNAVTCYSEAACVEVAMAQASRSTWVCQDALGRSKSFAWKDLRGKTPGGDRRTVGRGADNNGDGRRRDARRTRPNCV